MFPFAGMFLGCDTPQNPSDPEQTRVMNVSLNPQLEFVLDTENKVVSVNALNDEGNKIILSATFVGLSAEDAIDKFLEIAKQDGYIITGDVDAKKNRINVSISGDSENLLKAVKDSALEYLQSVEVNGEILAESIVKSDLVAKVEECMREYERDQLNEMTEAQLIELIEQSRNETKELHTQELKELYYAMRENAMIEAKFAKIETLVKGLPSSLNTVKTAVLAYIMQLEKGLEKVEEQMQAYFTEGGAYQLALQAFMVEKQALLTARLEGTATQLQELAAQTKAESLALAKETVEAAVELAQSALNVIITQIETTLGTVLETSQSSIQAAIDTAREDFQLDFTVEFADLIESNNNAWVTLGE